VRLIDGDQRGFSLREHFGEAGHPKPFWSNEEEL
jgi:hypothetical protein